MSTSNKIEVRNPIPFGLGNVEVRSLQNSSALPHLDKKRKNPKTEGANGQKHKSSNILVPVISLIVYMCRIMLEK